MEKAATKAGVVQQTVKGAPRGCVFRQAASRREPLRLARAPKPRDSACGATAGHAASAPHALLALFCAAPSVWPLGVC
jgi:hypothetical protein